MGAFGAKENLETPANANFALNLAVLKILCNFSVFTIFVNQIEF